MIRTVRNPILGSASFWTENLSILGFKTKTLSQLVSEMFKSGEQGFFYDPSSLTDGTYGLDKTSIGVPVTVGVADAAEYDNSLHTGHVYRADQYNQSIVNFDVNNSLTHEIVIENTGSATIAVNADLAMGTVLFTVAAGQLVTRIISPVQVIVITSANDVSTAYFKIHSLKEFSGQYTMYQDAAGTVPVTGVGQPVGLIRDKSGRNNHARQTNSASRPILRKNAVTGFNYLEFDGSDDFFVTNSIDFTSTDELNLFVGLRRSGTPSTAGIILELSSSLSANTGTFYLASPNTPTNLNSITFVSKGTSASSATISNYTEPSVVVSAQAKISTDTNTVRLNGVQRGSNTVNQGTGNYGNHPLYIGRRGIGVLPFNGNIYGLIGVGRLTTDIETAAIEKELIKRTGVTLSV